MAEAIQKTGPPQVLSRSAAGYIISTPVYVKPNASMAQATVAPSLSASASPIVRSLETASRPTSIALAQGTTYLSASASSTVKPLVTVVKAAPVALAQGSSQRVVTIRPASVATGVGSVLAGTSPASMTSVAQSSVLSTPSVVRTPVAVATPAAAPKPTSEKGEECPPTIALPPPGPPDDVFASPNPSRVVPDELPAWSELRCRCDQDVGVAVKAGREIDMVSVGLGDLENGSTNPFAKLRLFGRPASEVRVTLYRDSSGWCGYCQKLWLYLEEKSIPYRCHKGNLRCYGERAPWLMEVNPKGLMPVVVLEGPFVDSAQLPPGHGKVLLESKAILMALEEEFPEPPLVERTPAGLARMEELYSLAARVTGYAFSALLGYGPLSAFAERLDLLNAELKVCPGPYLLPQFSLADIHLAPFLERARACLLFAKGFDVRALPRYDAVDRWFQAMELRPCYVGTQSDFFNLVHFLPPQAGWFALENNPEEFIAGIDGTDGSWRLPLQPSRFEQSRFSEIGALEASMKLVVNHERLVGFSQRSEKAPEPLAVDAAFRMVVCILLGDRPESLSLPGAKLGSPSQRECAARACRYVRDRIGVPRDMRLGSARHFRAALNEVLELLGFDSQVKDLQTTPSGGLTYAPKDSRHVADLRALAQLA